MIIWDMLENLLDTQDLMAQISDRSNDILGYVGELGGHSGAHGPGK